MHVSAHRRRWGVAGPRVEPRRASVGARAKGGKGQGSQKAFIRAPKCLCLCAFFGSLFMSMTMICHDTDSDDDSKNHHHQHIHHDHSVWSQTQVILPAPPATHAACTTPVPKNHSAAPHRTSGSNRWSSARALASTYSVAFSRAQYQTWLYYIFEWPLNFGLEWGLRSCDQGFELVVWLRGMTWPWGPGQLGHNA